MVEVVINQGKNVMLATTMQSAPTTMLAPMGLTPKVTVVNAADVGGGMTAMMSGNVLVMPLILMSAACSVLLTMVFKTRPAAGPAERARAVGKRLAYAVGASFLIAGAAVLMVTWIGGMDVPVGSLLLFSWIAGLAVMALFLGALSISMPVGAVVIAGCFLLGMSSAMLARDAAHLLARLGVPVGPAALRRAGGVVDHLHGSWGVERVGAAAADHRRRRARPCGRRRSPFRPGSARCSPVAA